jgi:hypothetical protein
MLIIVNDIVGNDGILIRFDQMHRIFDMMPGCTMMYTMNIIYCQANKNPQKNPVHPSPS